MANQWKAGDVVMDRARATGDYRGAMLQGAKRNAEAMGEAASGFVGAAIGASAIAMIGMVSAAALASGGHLAPVACSVFMQTCLGAAVGGIVSAGLAKMWKSAEQAKAAELAPAVRSIEAGRDTQAAIDLHLGDKMAAKLGGWRKPNPVNIASQSPQDGGIKP